jgi:release factor glutamine methyltransferase
MPETAPSDAPWTVGRLLAWTRAHLDTHGIDEPRLSAELLLARALGCRRIELYTRFDQVPTDAQRAGFRELVRAAAGHRPIAYLVGVKEFYSLEFIVTPDVLIPRPETELLVERALAWCRQNPRERIDLLDIGTGSGCIAIAVARRVPALQAVATDSSPAALAVAAENARRHGAAGIRFVEADLLDLPAEAVPDGGFDIILSNPPYVAESDAAALPEDVRRHEPAAALFAGPDGLAAFRGIAAGVRRLLRPGGLLAVEVGAGQADGVAAIFMQAGLPAPTRHRDLAGIERVVEFVV